MCEANKDEVAKINVSMQTNGNPINLLQRFTPEKREDTGLSESEQPDLNLRLSLGGSYSEISKENPLIRSSSVAGIITQNENAGETSFLSLSRSSSLPTEAEQERRKVKELKSLRRMEAKRRMLEKQNMLAGNRTIQGQGSLTTAMDLTSSRSLPVQRESEAVVRRAETKVENPSKKAKVYENVMQGSGMEVMKQMPSVTTTGNGPNGRKIEGFLYKYMKGQVSIVCVCHGSFLSPAEFVKHAGGGDVANPMKHINVCSTSLFF